MTKRIADVSYSDWRRIFDEQLALFRNSGDTSGAPAWDDGGLVVIGLRMNDIRGFYSRTGGFDDFLVLIDDRARRPHVFACTTDPAVGDFNPKGIAHLCEGAWASYVRGLHKGEMGRKALVQTAGPVKVFRTDKKGNATVRERGYFGINIHNAVGLSRPSAGCTVLKPDGFGPLDKNFRAFRTLLEAAPERPVRTYMLINAPGLAVRGYILSR